MLDTLRIVIYLVISLWFFALAWWAFRHGQFGHTDDWEKPITRAAQPKRFYAVLVLHLVVAITCVGLAGLKQLEGRAGGSDSPPANRCIKP